MYIQLNKTHSPLDKSSPKTLPIRRQSGGFVGQPAISPVYDSRYQEVAPPESYWKSHSPLSTPTTPTTPATREISARTFPVGGVAKSTTIRAASSSSSSSSTAAASSSSRVGMVPTSLSLTDVVSHYSVSSYIHIVVNVYYIVLVNVYYIVLVNVYYIVLVNVYYIVLVNVYYM